MVLCCLTMFNKSYQNRLHTAPPCDRNSTCCVRGTWQASRGAHHNNISIYASRDFANMGPDCADGMA